MGIKGRRCAIAGLGLAVALSGCGPFMVVRQGRKLFSEIEERNKTLAAQKEGMWSQLSPQLLARCRAAASPGPRRALRAQPVVAFDSSDEALTVPDAVAGRLDIRRARWAALKYDRPADADYLVFWERQVLRSEPLLTLEAHTLRLEDRSGRALASDLQFALHWQGEMQPEYLRCARLLGAGNERPPTSPAPDFGWLDELFGPRG